MESNIEKLEPRKVFKYFSDICAIPHGSGNLDGIVNYLVDFAKSHNLKYIVDDVKNVIIYKDSCSGEPVILQAHMDMVCVKTPSSTKDMTKDPLDIYIDGEYLKARDTSLGADDGIGVAIILAILDDNENEYPPIEALFTSDEETGMYGAIGVGGKLFKSKRLINIDSEDENELTVSCAGGSHCISELPIDRLNIETIGANANIVGDDILSSRVGASTASPQYDINNKNYILHKIVISGGLGGHSGMEIHKGRANAICEMAYVLKQLQDENVDFYLSSITGGKFINVICPEATCNLYVSSNDEEKFNTIILKLEAELKLEYSLCDPNIKVICSGECRNRSGECQTRSGECLQSPNCMGELCEPENCRGELGEPMSKESTSKVINTLFSLPQGLIEVSQEFINLPWTSLNLGVIETKKDKIVLATLVRSNDDLKKNKLVKKYETIIKSAGGSFRDEGSYPAWRYNKDSKLKSSMIETYKELFGKDINVVATHGGLECGLLMERIPGLEAVSIGPTMYGVHSTDEKLKIDSVGRLYGFLVEFLKKN